MSNHLWLLNMSLKKKDLLISWCTVLSVLEKSETLGSLTSLKFAVFWMKGCITRSKGKQCSIPKVSRVELRSAHSVHSIEIHHLSLFYCIVQKCRHRRVTSWKSISAPPAWILYQSAADYLSACWSPLKRAGQSLAWGAKKACLGRRVEEFSIQSVSLYFFWHLVITMTGVMPHCGSIYQRRSFHAKFSPTV